MGLKRPSSEIPPDTFDRRASVTKRSRLSPTKDSASTSSGPSTCSVSEDSALRSSPPASEHTRNSSLDSAALSVNVEGDDTDTSISTSSSSSSSSDEDDSEDVDDEDVEMITTIPARKKPPIRSSSPLRNANDLRARLASLLPRMAEANELLKNGGTGASMEEVEDDERHIEMELGLGVLEERHDDTSSESDSSEDEKAEQQEEKDIFGRLIGRERGQGGVGIEPIA